MFLPAIVSINFYFEKNRSFALGIAAAGAGVGTFAFAPLNRFLLENFKWRGAFMIKAAIVLNGCVLGLLVRPVPIEQSEIKRQKQKLLKKNPHLKPLDKIETKQKIKQFIKENLMDWELITDLAFLTFAISNFLTSFGFNTPYIYIVDQAVESGITAHQADWLVSIIGLSSVFGRIFFGLITDLKFVNRMMVYIGVLFVWGAATALEPFFVSYSGLVFYSLVFGLTSGKVYNFNIFSYLHYVLIYFS